MTWKGTHCLTPQADAFGAFGLTKASSICMYIDVSDAPANEPTNQLLIQQ